MNHLLYEQYKQQWVHENPNATPQKYEAYIRLLTKMLGI